MSVPIQSVEVHDISRSALRELLTRIVGGQWHFDEVDTERYLVVQGNRVLGVMHSASLYIGVVSFFGRLDDAVSIVADNDKRDRCLGNRGCVYEIWHVMDDADTSPRRHGTFGPGRGLICDKPAVSGIAGELLRQEEHFGSEGCVVKNYVDIMSMPDDGQYLELVVKSRETGRMLFLLRFPITDIFMAKAACRVASNLGAMYRLCRVSYQDDGNFIKYHDIDDNGWYGVSDAYDDNIRF